MLSTTSITFCRTASPYVDKQRDPSAGNVRPRNTLQYASTTCIASSSFTNDATGY